MKEKRSAEGIAAASCENADSMRELSLINRALEKCRIPMRIDVGSVGGFLREELASLGIGGEVDIGIPEIEPRTVYRLTDRFSRSFTIFSHGGEEGRRVAVIGPYLSFELTEKHGFSIGERLRLSPSDTRELSKYLETLATVKEGSPINAMLSALFESTWGSAGYTVVTLNEGEVVNEPAPQAIASGSDNILKMRSMERRYELENVLMDAVTRGSTDTEDLLRYSITPETLEQRVLDPLRNAKNYCIIMNTLLRKAAERGGVHPLYLDEMSSANARRIEALSSHQRTPELMSEMLRGYCRLVKRHAHKDYSPVVRRAVIMIDADLSADLSAGAIAEVLDVSLGYLSSAFKRDVGRTLSEYVRERRMEYAEQLLRGTDLQVQSVAQSVGMVDLNYFTRLFKSHTGMTPTEFRRKKQ